jgi:hypothetical protein
MSNGQNSVYADNKEFMREVRRLADQEASGELARPEFFVQVTIATREGVVGDTSLRKDEAPAAVTWNAYAEKANAKAAKAGIVRSKGAEKVRISEVNQLILATMKNDAFPELLSAAKPVIQEMKLSGEYNGNTQDAFIAIARAQKESDTLLSEEEVRDAIRIKPRNVERKEIDVLEKQLKALKVLRDGTEGTDSSPPKEPFPSEQLDVAISAIEERLGVLRLAESMGTTPQVMAAQVCSLTSAGY